MMLRLNPTVLANVTNQDKNSLKAETGFLNSLKSIDFSRFCGNLHIDCIYVNTLICLLLAFTPHLSPNQDALQTSKHFSVTITMN